MCPSAMDPHISLPSPQLVKAEDDGTSSLSEAQHSWVTARITLDGVQPIFKAKLPAYKSWMVRSGVNSAALRPASRDIDHSFLLDLPPLFPLFPSPPGSSRREWASTYSARTRRSTTPWALLSFSAASPLFCAYRAVHQCCHWSARCPVPVSDPHSFRPFLP